MNRRRLLSSVILLALTIVSAPPAEAAWHWVSNVTVKAIESYSGASFTITFSTSDSSCQNTSAPDKAFYVANGVNGVDADQAKAMLALAISAKMSSSTVTYLYDDSTAYCYVTAIQVN